MTSAPRCPESHGPDDPAADQHPLAADPVRDRRQAAAREAAAAIRTAATTPTAATPPSRKTSTAKATLKALSLPQIAPKETCARRIDARPCSPAAFSSFSGHEASSLCAS